MVNKRWTCTEKLHIISLDFYIRNTDRMEKKLKQEGEQLLFLILLMQILCNFCMFVLVQSKLWSVIFLLTLFCINHNNLLLHTGTFVTATNFTLLNHTS